MASVPREARSYQGASAGVVTRVAAGVVDALVVALALAGSYAAWVALVFALDPRRFSNCALFGSFAFRLFSIVGAHICVSRSKERTKTFRF